MKFFTSNYVSMPRLKKENPNYIFVSISGDIPDYINEQVQIWDKRLAPNWDLFKEYKASPEGAKREDKYVKRFKEEVLLNRNINEIFKSWSDIYGLNEKYVLLCYETPNDFCHRHIVSEAIEQKYGIEVPELLVDKNHTKINYRYQLDTEIDADEW